MRKNQEFWESGNSSLKHRVFLLGLFFIISSLIVLYILGEVIFYCPFNRFLNFQCLTCGSTTAFRSLINGGSIFSVFTHNPLFYLWFILFFISYFDFMLLTVFNKKNKFLYKILIVIEKKLIIRYLFYLAFILNLVFLNFIK